MHKKRASNTIRSLVHPVGKWSKPQVRLGRRVACPSEKRLLHSDEFDTSKNSSIGLSTQKNEDQPARNEEMKKNERAGYAPLVALIIQASSSIRETQKDEKHSTLNKHSTLHSCGLLTQNWKR
jgi:hypothetical protein